MTTETAKRTLLTRLKIAAKAAGLFIAAVLILSTGAALWGVSETKVERPDGPPIVNDVTQLNPIEVAKIITPTTTEEIMQAVRTHKGPISIGGGRYSMGGQTATERALQIDMRQFNKILDFSRADKTITVQAGARWRQIQEHIDPHDLSIMIMQTYSNFTVGGSLSVNVHGRYIGAGPLIHSVKSLRVVLPDGSLVEASPNTRRDIFYGVIGGYGGLGVITEATLRLEDNVRVERKAEKMPIARYKDYFFNNIRNSRSAVFHNADIYPDEYDAVRAVSYLKTEKPVTVKERLIPKDASYRLDRFVYWVISEWPFGKDIRQYIVDPLLFAGESVRWRNYEASYDVAELEPSSREGSTYVLQEYFVPVARFDEFIPKARYVLRSGGVNVINGTIRHAHRDPGAMLAWAREEVFAFVLYYKQNTDAESRKKVATWTRELVDAVLSVGGSYYLPYQPHATEEQFLKAYARAPEFFALKRKLDPENRFRNKLWDKYYASVGSVRKALAPDVREELHRRAGYLRDGGQTYLTHPEWHIVYSYDEFAGNQRVDEDRYAYRVAKEYADFTHLHPWYEYSFWNKLTGLWSETPLWGKGAIRKWERKLVMSLEFGIKSVYGWLIAIGSGTVYDTEADRLQMVVANWGAAAAAGVANFKIMEKLDDTHALAATPRYDAFRDVMLALARSGAQLELSEISGNSDILVTGVAPSTWRYEGSRGTMLYALPLSTDGSRKRVAMRVPTRDLIALLREVQPPGKGLVVDHIY